MSHREHDPDNFDEAAIFHEGLRLFNERDWFEAHEVWEDIWRPASGEVKRFYQGLIQLAVTLVHAQRGNPRGVRAVHATCLTKFEGLPDVYMGVPVAHILGWFETVIRPILNLPDSYFDPAKGRGLDIPFDEDAVPTIELEADPFGD